MMPISKADARRIAAMHAMLVEMRDALDEVSERQDPGVGMRLYTARRHMLRVETVLKGTLAYAGADRTVCAGAEADDWRGTQPDKE